MKFSKAIPVVIAFYVPQAIGCVEMIGRWDATGLSFVNVFDNGVLVCAGGDRDSNGVDFGWVVDASTNPETIIFTNCLAGFGFNMLADLSWATFFSRDPPVSFEMRTTDIRETVGPGVGIPLQTISGTCNDACSVL